MDKPHRKPWPRSKTSDISKQSPSPRHHTFLLGRARFTAQPLSALIYSVLSGIALYANESNIDEQMIIHAFHATLDYWFNSGEVAWLNNSIHVDGRRITELQQEESIVLDSQHRWPKRNMRVCMGKKEFET